MIEIITLETGRIERKYHEQQLEYKYAPQFLEGRLAYLNGLRLSNRLSKERREMEKLEVQLGGVQGRPRPKTAGSFTTKTRMEMMHISLSTIFLPPEDGPLARPRWGTLPSR